MGIPTLRIKNLLHPNSLKSKENLSMRTGCSPLLLAMDIAQTNQGQKFTITELRWSLFGQVARVGGALHIGQAPCKN